MSTPFPIDQEPPRDVLAGEYVLGLLSADDRLAVSSASPPMRSSRRQWRNSKNIWRRCWKKSPR